jgi:hypothetical protein
MIQYPGYPSLLCCSSGSQGRVRRLKDVHEIVPPDVCEDFHEVSEGLTL